MAGRRFSGAFLWRTQIDVQLLRVGVPFASLAAARAAHEPTGGIDFGIAQSLPRL